MFFFFNDPATTEIYTLSLHDALPIWEVRRRESGGVPRRPLHQLDAVAVGIDDPRREEVVGAVRRRRRRSGDAVDRKSTRLNSSHANISYAVFCLKKINSSHANTSYAV